jgi:plastocyanin
VRARRLAGLALAALATGIPAAHGATAEVMMPGTVFTPAAVRVLTGDSVMFANHDTRPHTATAVDASFDTGSILPHGDATVGFPVVGSFAYFCRIHSFMRGQVDVVALLLAGPATPPAKGAAVTLTGRAGTGIASVTLERSDGAAWTTVATTTPGANGVFAFGVRLTAATTFRVRAGTATSDPVTLRPIDLRVGLSRTARHGSRYTLRAGVAPAGGAAVVTFQLYVPERFSWRTIARRRFDSAGHARLTVRALHRVRIRAVVRTGGADVVSPAVRIGRLPPFG